MQSEYHRLKPYTNVSICCVFEFVKYNKYREYVFIVHNLKILLITNVHTITGNSLRI